MNCFGIITGRRIKTEAGAVSVATHNLRKNGIKEYVDPEYTKYNAYEGPADSKEFVRNYHEVLQKAKLQRKPQKNASRVIEFVVTTSHEFCEDWKVNQKSKQELTDYFADASEFIRRKYGDVVLSTAVHWDETTPHMHVMCIPLCRVPGTDKVLFSSSHFLGGFKELHLLQTEFHEQVGRKYGLMRGIEGSRTKHSDLKQYKKWENAQKEKLQTKETELASKEEDLFKTEAVVGKKESEITFREKKLVAKEQRYSEYEKAVNNKVPVIPELPVFYNNEERKTWRDSVQMAVGRAFLKMKVAYDTVVKKFNTLAHEFNRLLAVHDRTVSERDEWKRRAAKAEHDLETRPLDEIQAARNRAARISRGGIER